MDKPLLIAAVVVVICGFLVFLVVALMSGSMVVRDRMVETADDMNLGESNLFGKSFKILGARYFNRTLAMDETSSPCESGQETVIVNILFDTSALPDRCDITVDRAFQKSITPHEKGCGTRCKDFIQMAVDIKPQAAARMHNIEVCCDSVCLDTDLGPIC